MNEILDALTAGHRLFVLLIAYGKALLRDGGLRAGEQQRLLERINGAVDMHLTPEMIAAIEPMGAIECQMLDAALSLDPPADGKTDVWTRRRASCDMLMRCDVFAHFVGLNTGIQRALELYRDNAGRHVEA
jgi:hypothetical protein